MSQLDDILALLTGRKVYDVSTNQWRIYDAADNEIADPGGVLLRGLHGWLLNPTALTNPAMWLLIARRRGAR